MIALFGVWMCMALKKKISFSNKIGTRDMLTCPYFWRCRSLLEQGKKSRVISLKFLPLKGFWKQ